MADEEDEYGGEIAASDLVLIAYGRDEDDRAAFLDRCEVALEEMGISYSREDDNIIHADLVSDALSQLDDLAGWVGDPELGVNIQAGVIDDAGEFIPISHAFETWEELLNDVEEHIDDYLEKYGAE